jgi:choline-sulfatase
MSVARVLGVTRGARRLTVTAAAIAIGLAAEVALREHARRSRGVSRSSASEDGAASPTADDTDADRDATPFVDAERPPQQRRPMNILLITIDTLRWDLGFMGYPRAITPNLDALAERAVVFERAYATASYTPKSLGPLLIGKYASETFRDREHYTTFYPANVFVAERLKVAGYRTIGVMGHHYFKWKTGFDQGFDVWDTTTVPAQARDDDTAVTSERLTDVAIRLLDDDGAERPFFAWVHYLDPHAPYVPHEDVSDLGARAPDAGAGRDVYDQEVCFTDKHVGRLLDFVQRKEWASNTAIIVTADHGEAFGERGFVRHGRELWESIVRVPLLVFVPEAPPHRVTMKRSHIDLAPTLLDLAAVTSATDGSLRGRSLLPDIDAASGAELEERDVYLDMPEGPFNEARRALITGTTPGRKLVDFGGDRYELYDLASDPLESRPLADPIARKEAIAKLVATRRGLEERPAAP